MRQGLHDHNLVAAAATMALTGAGARRRRGEHARSVRGAGRQPGTRPPSRSAPPIASSPRPRIRISIRATRWRRLASRRSRPPTSCSPTRRSAGSTIAARSTPAAHRRCASSPTVTLPRDLRRRRYSGTGSFENAADLEDMIQELFGGRAGGRTVQDAGRRRQLSAGDRARRGRPWRQGADHAGRRIERRGDDTAGVEAGQVLRLKGKGWRRCRRWTSRRRADRDPGAPTPGVRAQGGRHLTWRCPLTPGRSGARREGDRSDTPGPGGHDHSPALEHGRACCGSRARALPRPGGAGAGDQYVRLEVAATAGRPTRRSRRRSRIGSVQHPYDPRADLMREARAVKRLDEVLVELGTVERTEVI